MHHKTFNFYTITFIIFFVYIIHIYNHTKRIIIVYDFKSACIELFPSHHSLLSFSSLSLSLSHVPGMALAHRFAVTIWMPVHHNPDPTVFTDTVRRTSLFYRFSYFGYFLRIFPSFERQSTVPAYLFFFLLAGILWILYWMTLVYCSK